MKTLVLGLGNPILSDDSVGFRVIDRLKEKFDKPGLTFAQSSASGISLLDEIVGYDSLIIIDAIQTRGGKVGEVYRFTLADFIDTRHLASTHGINLATAIELGQKLGESVPRRSVIFAVEVSDVANFGENCTPEVELAIPVCTEMVVQELSGE